MAARDVLADAEIAQQRFVVPQVRAAAGRKLGDAEDAAALGRRHADLARRGVGAPETLAGDSSVTQSSVDAFPALRCLTFGAALSISTVERPSGAMAGDDAPDRPRHPQRNGLLFSSASRARSSGGSGLA
jgi:hypothetical protein